MPSEMEIYVYGFLIDGSPQSRIVKKLFKKFYGSQLLGENDKKKILKRLRDKVSYYARKLERNGYIEVLTRRAKPMVYRATLRTPVKSEKKDTDCWDQSFNGKIDIHHISYKFNVEVKPRRPILWNKPTERLRSGVLQRFAYFKYDIGKLTIRYQEFPNGRHEVVIWLPKIELPSDLWEKNELVMRQYIFKASAQIQKMLQCRLGLPEVYRGPHYEVDVREPALREFAENNTIKVNDLWVDSSPPSKKPKIESDNIDNIIDYLRIPQLNIPDRVLALEKHMDKVLTVVEKLVEQNQSFIVRMEEFMGFKRETEKRLDEENKVKMYG